MSPKTKAAATSAPTSAETSAPVAPVATATEAPPVGAPNGDFVMPRSTADLMDLLTDHGHFLAPSGTTLDCIWTRNGQGMQVTVQLPGGSAESFETQRPEEVDVINRLVTLRSAQAEFARQRALSIMAR